MTFYSIKMIGRYNNEPMKFSVGIVEANNKKEAMQKALLLYSPYEIDSIEINELSNEYLEKIKQAKGGAILGEIDLDEI